MENPFDRIMQNSPFLAGLINAKIAEEVAKKDVDILALQEGNQKLKDNNNDLEARVTESERSALEASATQEELINILVEAGVI